MAYEKLGLTNFLWPSSGTFTSVASATIDAAGERAAFIGHVKWSDGGSHTIDSTGSSKIYIHTGASPVFDDVTSVMRLGLQGVDTTTGTPVRPDGSWTAYADVTTSNNTSPTLTTANSLCGITPGSGTDTIADGDLVAVVAEITTLGGTTPASVTFLNNYGSPLVNAQHSAFPASCSYTSGSWSGLSSNGSPIILLRASDGTWGTFYGCNTIGQVSTVPYSDSSGTDEYGMIFQVPFNCKIDAIVVSTQTILSSGTTSDFNLDVTSTPTGTPSSVVSGPISVTAESFSSPTVARGMIWKIPLTSLTADTDYCVSLKATSSGTITLAAQTLPDAGARALFDGNTTSQGATRNGGSGAYTGSTTVMYSISVRIAEIEVTSSGGGGSHFSAFGG